MLMWLSGTGLGFYALVAGVILSSRPLIAVGASLLVICGGMVIRGPRRRKSLLPQPPYPDVDPSDPAA
jgi:hypothetical protein